MQRLLACHFSNHAAIAASQALLNDCRACPADYLIQVIGTPRTSDRADQLTVLDQWNAATRRNDSIQRQQVIQIVDLDTVLEDLGFAAEGRGRPRLGIARCRRPSDGVQRLR